MYEHESFKFGALFFCRLRYLPRCWTVLPLHTTHTYPHLIAPPLPLDPPLLIDLPHLIDPPPLIHPPPLIDPPHPLPPSHQITSRPITSPRLFPPPPPLPVHPCNPFLLKLQRTR